MTSGGSSGPASLAHPVPAPRPPFLLIVSVTVTGIMANVLVAPVIPDIAAEFGVGAAGAGLFLAASTAPGILVAPVIGVLADRFGRREVLAPCLTVFALSGGLCAWAPVFGALIALRFLQGVGGAGLINLAVALIADHWEGAERARRMGRNAAALTASIAVLPVVGGGLGALGGWRLTFAPYWLALLTTVAVVRRLPRSLPVRTRLVEQLRETAPHLRSRPVLGAMSMAFVLFLLLFGLSLTVLPIHLAQSFGVGAGGRGAVMAGSALTATLTSLASGRVRDRIGTGWLLLASWAVLAVGFGVLAAAASLPVVLAAVLTYGLAEGLIIPTLQDLVAGSPPASSRAAVVAVFVGVTRAGQTIGPVVTGSAVELTGAPALFAIGAGVAAVTGAVQWFLPPITPARGCLRLGRRDH
jgi:ACDE family multidrug resistance protein